MTKFQFKALNIVRCSNKSKIELVDKSDCHRRLFRNIESDVVINENHRRRNDEEVDKMFDFSKYLDNVDDFQFCKSISRFCEDEKSTKKHDRFDELLERIFLFISIDEFFDVIYYCFNIKLFACVKIDVYALEEIRMHQIERLC